VPAGVVTPEAVVLELPTAGTGTRSYARLADFLVQGVVAAVLAWIAVPLVSAGVSPVLTTLVIVVIVLLGVPIGVEVLWRGRSVGKAIFGLRVVSADGSPAVPRQAVLRGLIALIDTYASLGFLALVTAMFTPSSQRPGDLAAGTVVIRDRGGAATSRPIAFHPPFGYEAYVSTLDVSALDDEDFSLIREYLLRVGSFSPRARYDRARSLAEGVRVRIHHTLPAPIAPEIWLVCVASAYQLRRGGLLADAALGLSPLEPRTTFG
jgi:uncharacterized RDD family membrane protein YckC